MADSTDNDPLIRDKLLRVDDMLPREITGSFADKRYSSLYGSFVNLLDDGFFSVAIFNLVRLGGAYERNGHSLAAEFWELVEEIVRDCDAEDDYMDWRNGEHGP